MFRLSIRFAFLCLVSCLMACSGPETLREGPSVTVLTWNVENLFDDVKDGTEYPEFDPSRTWSAAQMTARMERLADVVRESCPRGPDVVALQEVENRRTLEILRSRFLEDYAAVFVPAPGRTVGCGFLTRLPVNRVALLQAPSGKEPLRPSLEIELEVRGHVLIFIGNHWKSRLPSAVSTEPSRLAAATLVRSRLSALRRERPQALVIVLGDFNTSLEFPGSSRNPALIPAGAPGPGLRLGAQPGAGDAWDLWSESPEPGSYLHKGRWERLDHILWAGSEPTSPWSLERFAVVKLDRALNPDGSPRAWSPRDRGGTSDHLPLLAEFRPKAPR